MNFFESKFRLVIECLMNLFPIKNNLVVFYSFKGYYNDNPKIISELLHEKYPDVEQVWILQNVDDKRVPSYIKKVKLYSLKSLYYSSVAKVYIDNYTGKHTFRYKDRHIPFYIKFIKRNNQINISTWHGTPLKKIHNDILGYECNQDNCFTTCDYFISGNRYLSTIISKSLADKISVIEVGTPRNDILMNYDSNYINQFKIANGIGINKKVLLYAPTFRDEKKNSGFTQIKLFDFEKLNNTLSAKFGGEWVVVFRAHPTLSNLVNVEYKELFENGFVVNGNQFSEMSDYLLISDVLVTDYSGSIFDFALLERPCFLFSDDLNHYNNVERGLYIQVESLPFSFSEDFNQLQDNIMKYDKDDYMDKVREFKDKLGYCEYGNATNYVINMINEIINYKRRSK